MLLAARFQRRAAMITVSQWPLWMTDKLAANDYANTKSLVEKFEAPSVFVGSSIMTVMTCPAES